MFDLVLWSFLVALSPLSLSLAWKLIAGVGDLLGFGHTQDLDRAGVIGHF